MQRRLYSILFLIYQFLIPFASFFTFLSSFSISLEFFLAFLPLVGKLFSPTGELVPLSVELLRPSALLLLPTFTLFASRSVRVFLSQLNASAAPIFLNIPEPLKSHTSIPLAVDSCMCYSEDLDSSPAHEHSPFFLILHRFFIKLQRCTTSILCLS